MIGSLSDVEFVVRTMAETAVAREQEFGELDAVVGDGDFGFSLARGFEKVLAEWDTYDGGSIGTFLKKVALTITSRAGGTTGPIWGTAFLRAGSVAAAKEQLTRADVVAMLEAACAGISARGGAQRGDKTLLDVLLPMVDVLDRAADDLGSEEVADAMAAEALRAAEATKMLQARRGRASYSGARSIGSVDAGGMAVALLAREIAAAMHIRASDAPSTAAHPPTRTETQTQP